MSFILGSKWCPRNLAQLSDIGFAPNQVYTLEWRDSTAFSLSLYAANGTHRTAPGSVTVARRGIRPTVARRGVIAATRPWRARPSPEARFPGYLGVQA